MTEPDAFDRLIRRYLSVQGRLDEAAYEVVMRWYTWLNVYATTVASATTDKRLPVSLDAVDAAFETPIMGLQGNVFWRQHGASVLALVSADMVASRAIREGARPEDVLFYNTLRRYSFMGFVVALVQQDGMHSWTQFELELRKILYDLVDRVVK